MKYCVGAVCYIELEAENRDEAIKKFFEKCPLETYEVDTVSIQDKEGFWVETNE